MNGRNDLYPNPFDEFDPHHTLKGKKAFKSTERCIKTNINLENHTEALKAKAKPSISVRKHVIDEFDRLYLENCDNKKMEIK